MVGQEDDPFLPIGWNGLNFGREIDLWDTRGRQAFGGRPSMVLEERQRYSVDLLQEKKGVNKPPGM